jgi:ketosteroid isomerase-like protein
MNGVLKRGIEFFELISDFTGDHVVLEVSCTHLLRFPAFRLGGFMRIRFCFAAIAVLASLAWAQQPTVPTQFGEGKPAKVSASTSWKDMFEANVKAEWEAIKNKDKKAYAELLAEDYQGVEVDGRGERNKLQAVNELVETNVFNYTLWGFKLIPLEPDAAFVTYEVSMQFPPRSQVRYSRVYITELWMKRAGQWKEVHYQETHVK